MKKKAGMALAILAFASLAIVAQDTAKSPGGNKSDEHISAVIPLRVQVVFTEFDGEKKISSLPYSFTVNADERRARPGSQIRNGARIPIAVGKEQSMYLDIGTNIDCSATLQEDGRYKLQMTVERSSITPENASGGSNPVLKDGQTLESIVATDPLSGHVYHVSVTLNAMK